MKRAISISLSVTAIIAVFSCQKGKNVEEKKECVVTNSTQNQITCTSFYENERIKSEYLYKDSTLNGDYRLFYSNGQLKERGYYADGEKLGWIDYYLENGEILKQEHFAFNLLGDGIQYNQYVIYDDSEIDYDNSNFYEIQSTDTISVGEPFIAEIELVAPFHKSKTKAFLNTYKKGLSELYSKPGVEVLSDSFSIKYKSNPVLSLGRHTLLGYVYDYKDTVVNGDTATFGRKLFLAHNFWVRDSS